MADKGTAMPLVEARVIALRLRGAMQPFCERVEIAGSIRRDKPEVGDIEIVAVPKWEGQADPTDLFGERTIRRNLLWHEFGCVSPENRRRDCPNLGWIKPGVSEIRAWHISEAGKYWRGYLPDHGIKLDVFLATPENWGAIYLIRTGSADFSAAVMGHARRVGYRFEDGSFWLGSESKGGSVLPVYEERDVFDHLGLEFVPPRERTGPEALKRRRLGP